MGFSQIKKKAHSLFECASFISHIRNFKEYERALALMDELIEDYDNQRPLIEVLSVSIERWEDQAKALQAFNKQLKLIDNEATVLRVLMDQHQLGVADFPEIGSKSLVSKILNGQRRLTLDHVRALSKRFSIDPSFFLKA